MRTTGKITPGLILLVFLALPWICPGDLEARTEKRNGSNTFSPLPENETDEPENPVSLKWIRRHLSRTTPRLILTPEVESKVREKLQANDPLTLDGFELLLQGAESVLELKPLTYKKEGRRLLGVSREALRRLSTLALAYRFEKEPRYLERLEEELRSVCAFGDWNPSHFLDVAEMAAGVALAVDWAGEWLSPGVSTIARQSLVEKALKPALEDTTDTWWITVHHNWNLVCHGGLSLAALTVFEDAPELATGVLRQAVENIPLALQPYAPSGVYPEGPSYWFYATSYLTLAINAYETALGTGFGFIGFPGVRESALFSQVLAGPSGDYFNYFDAGLGGFHNLEHFSLLAWFASRSGPGVDMEDYRILLADKVQSGRGDRVPRLFPVFFLYSALWERGTAIPAVPEVWAGWGEEPVVVMRDPDPEGNGFFLAAKGGCASDNHGNMDAGSFIFELNGVRWSVDPGNQGYFNLEQLMGDALWDNSQDSRRWSLLTKNNYGHSTLTVNGKLHLADARSKLESVDRKNNRPVAVFDLTGIFGENTGKVERSFTKVSDQCVRIGDRVDFSAATRTVTWQMITQAEVLVRNKAVYMRQEGKELALFILTDEPAEISVVDLDPPPLPYDKKIPGLKRIEITWERETFKGPSADLEVELNSNVYQRY